jgi:hypothetical protein
LQLKQQAHLLAQSGSDCADSSESEQDIRFVRLAACVDSFQSTISAGFAGRNGPIGKSHERRNYPRHRPGELHMRGKHVLIGVLAFIWLTDLSWADDPKPESSPPQEKKASADDRSKAYGTDAPAPINPTEVWRNLWADHADYEARIDSLYPVRPPWEAYPWHFYAEGGFFMVHTYFGQNPAFNITQGHGTKSATTTTHDIEFLDVNFGPKVLLGVESADGWGFRSYWWLIDEESEISHLTNGDSTGRTVVQSTPAVGVPGFSSPGTVAKAFKIFHDKFDFRNRVVADDWVWEATKDFQWDCWSFLITGGARYTYISQSFVASRLNKGTGTLGTSKVTLTQDSDEIIAGHNFGGVGPTILLELRRHIGDTGISLYGNARVSVIFGDETLTAFQQTIEKAKITPKKGQPLTINTSKLFSGRTTDENTVPMGDFEVGVNYTRDAGRVRLFLDVGMVNQSWFDVGSATTQHGVLGFFGLQVMAGFNF